MYVSDSWKPGLITTGAFENNDTKSFWNYVKSTRGYNVGRPYLKRQNFTY